MDDAAEAYRIATENGGIGVRPPATLKDKATGQVRSVLVGVCVCAPFKPASLEHLLTVCSTPACPTVLPHRTAADRRVL